MSRTHSSPEPTPAPFLPPSSPPSLRVDPDRTPALLQVFFYTYNMFALEIFILPAHSLFSLSLPRSLTHSLYLSHPLSLLSSLFPSSSLSSMFSLNTQTLCLHLPCRPSSPNLIRSHCCSYVYIFHTSNEIISSTYNMFSQQKSLIAIARILTPTKECVDR